MVPAKKPVPAGPNTLEELLQQFKLPVKVKSPEQVVMDVYYQEKFIEMEIDFLKDAPDLKFTGSFKINNPDGTKDIDFVPVLARPEILYCCHGKN